MRKSFSAMFILLISLVLLLSACGTSSKETTGDGKKAGEEKKPLRIAGEALRAAATTDVEGLTATSFLIRANSFSVLSDSSEMTAAEGRMRITSASN